MGLSIRVFDEVLCIVNRVDDKDVFGVLVGGLWCGFF